MPLFELYSSDSNSLILLQTQLNNIDKTTIYTIIIKLIESFHSLRGPSVQQQQQQQLGAVYVQHAIYLLISNILGNKHVNKIKRILKIYIACRNVYTPGLINSLLEALSRWSTAAEAATAAAGGALCSVLLFAY